MRPLAFLCLLILYCIVLCPFFHLHYHTHHLKKVTYIKNHGRGKNHTWHQGNTLAELLLLLLLHFGVLSFNFMVTWLVVFSITPRSLSPSFQAGNNRTLNLFLIWLKKSKYALTVRSLGFQSLIAADLLPKIGNCILRRSLVASWFTI